MARLKSWSRLHVSMRSRDHLKTIPGILSLKKVIQNTVFIRLTALGAY